MLRCITRIESMLDTTKKGWFNMNQSIIDKLETPCIVIDMEQTKKNLRKMQNVADVCHCKLRPHIKTHKMKLFAQMQIKYGAAGITCAKISEAEVMADGGIDDIFIAYPLIEDFRIRRAITLQRRISRLILSVDSLEGADALSRTAVSAGVIFEVRLEVDTGAKRTGVLRQKAAELALNVSKMPGLNITGIFTFKSMIYKDAPTTDKIIAGGEEGQMMHEIANAIRDAGVEIKDISAGSTPTGEIVAQTGMVNEIRPGTYIFNDYMITKEGASRLEDIAGHLYVTVVSTPCDEYAVINGGTKTFPMDITLNMPPYFYPGYAIVEGNDDLLLMRMNEEHGIISSKCGKTGLKVGQKLCLIPIHICTAINMQNKVYLYDGNDVTEQKVDARGMLV